MESDSFGSWRTSEVPRSPSPSPFPLFVERDGFDSPGGLVVNFDLDESSSAGPDGEENDGATEQTWREASRTHPVPTPLSLSLLDSRSAYQVDPSLTEPLDSPEYSTGSSTECEAAITTTGFLVPTRPTRDRSEPRTPDSSRLTRFTCLTSPDHLDPALGSDLVESIPIYLLPPEDFGSERKTRKTNRRLSAPSSLQTSSTALPISDQGRPNMHSVASQCGSRSGHHHRAKSLDLDRSWEGLKRTLSLGSTHSKSPRHCPRLSSVLESDGGVERSSRSSRARALKLGTVSALTSPSMMPVKGHGPVPSGPSSPSSTAIHHLCEREDMVETYEEGPVDDHWMLDDGAFALNLFPRPPLGGITAASGPTDGQRDGENRDKVSLKRDCINQSDVHARNDCSPTLPCFAPTAFETAPFDPSDQKAEEVGTHTTSPVVRGPSSHLETALVPPSFESSTSPCIPRRQELNEKEGEEQDGSRVGPLPRDPFDRRSTTSDPQSLSSPVETSTTLDSSSPSSVGTTRPSSSTSSIVLCDTVRTPGSVDEERTMAWCEESQVTPPITAVSTLPSSHPFHNRPTPALPSTTRTSSNTTLSSSHQDPPTFSSPPSSYSTLSRRHSKFTSFSGSSASSIHSSESSSLRHGQTGHHWGFGEKADISTVFEEDSLKDADGDSVIETHVDLSRPRDLPLPSDQRRQSINALNSKDTQPRGSTTPLPFDPSKRLIKQASSSDLSSHPPRTRNINNRTYRSDTISSQVSNGSEKTAKSAPHPFASIVVRPASPPLRSALRVHNATILSSSRSTPNLTEALKMQQTLPVPPAHQVTLGAEGPDDGNKCPVCHESLSAEYRLAGEKPLVVAECGHEVHYACFEMCYGEVPPPGSRKQIGVCGICRQPMRVAESAGRRSNKKSNKLAMLTGEMDDDSPFASRDNAPSSAASMQSGGPASSSNGTPANDTFAEDPLVPPTPAPHSSKSAVTNAQQQVVVPTISVKSEFPSISKINRASKGQVMTAMITVTVPPAGQRGKYSPAVRSSNTSTDDLSPQLPPSPRSQERPSIERQTASTPSEGGAFAHIVQDLRNRVTDYQDSGLDTIGSLRLFDLLSVRKGFLMREFNVYLFQEALICITEERKSGIRSFFSASSARSESNPGKAVSSSTAKAAQARGALKLKGRIYLRHVARIVDSSQVGELSLTIEMMDERMDAFILVFRDRGSHSTWKRTLETIVNDIKNEPPRYRAPNTAPPVAGYPEKSSKKIAQLMGNGAPMPRSASVPGHSESFDIASSSSANSLADLMSPSSGGFPTGTSATSAFDYTPPPIQEPAGGELVFNAPLGPIHTPIDLVVIMSLPAQSATNGQAGSQMKNRIMRQTLAFMLASMGPRDRVALVSAEQGTNGVIRKTPFLNPTRFTSRQRLEAFVDILGCGRTDNDDFEVHTSDEERVDVVTAMNVALDVVLQRKARNPIGSLLVISDSVENIKRAQMDLVTARLDAANLPVHSFGYGKGHDPSPLWMFSNHTHGTYTFVKEWYDLQNAMAGVLGGLMSIAITNMKLHLTCSDNEYKVVRVAGVSESIVSQGGKEVEVELKEMRFGETRELLVEIDLANSPPSPNGGSQRHSGETTGSDVQLGASVNGSLSRSASTGLYRGADSTLGLDALSVSDTQKALNDALYESATIDEEPVIELNCSYHDPSANRSVTRLSQPVLLVCAVLPASAPAPTAPGNPMVIRRRMEILAADMMTRALLIASRKNISQATRVLSQTKTIITSVADRMRSQLSPGVEGNKASATKREMATLAALESLEAIMNDLDTLIDGLEEQPDMFERDTRNFAAQQAIVLRAQKSWLARCATQRMYVTPGVDEMINISAGWKAIGRSV